jgi:hypothetical protein
MSQAWAEAQLCGSTSAMGLIGCVMTRDNTSLSQEKGSTPTRWQDATRLRSTGAVLPPSSLPKNVQFARPTAMPWTARSTVRSQYSVMQ